MRRSHILTGAFTVGAIALAATGAVWAQTDAPAKVGQTPVAGPVAGTLMENVCHLSTARFPWGGGSSTGVLFEGRYILTAGHNIYQDISRLKRVTVRCGVTTARSDLRCDRDPNCQEVAKGWQTMDAQHYDLFNLVNQHDYGVIRLNTPIATTTPVTLADAVPAIGGKLLLAGYPAGKSVYDGRTMTSASAQVTEVNDVSGKLEYNINTFTGNSGGPVWQVLPDGSYKLLAIHIQPSEGRLVNTEFKTEIRRIMRKLDERAAKRRM